jgi:glycosyltransferase family protein
LTVQHIGSLTDKNKAIRTEILNFLTDSPYIADKIYKLVLENKQIRRFGITLLKITETDFIRRYYLCGIRIWKNKNNPKIMSYNKMLENLYNGASMTRLGDGEFELALGHDLKFQPATKKLSEYLRDIISAESNSKLMICIAPFSMKNFTPSARKFWKNYWRNNWMKIRSMIRAAEYGNAFISRAEYFTFVRNGLEKLKKIWDNRDVVFVVPTDGHFINDVRIFGNVKSSETIPVPAMDAFSEYDKILESAKQYSKDTLFVICAGPTATVLAYDLYHLGYQALDLGHLPNCYAQYLGESPRPEAIPYKK